jgi:hypothetical protein
MEASSLMGPSIFRYEEKISGLNVKKYARRPRKSRPRRVFKRSRI